jgi:hypothetical protein
MTEAVKKMSKSERISRLRKLQKTHLDMADQLADLGLLDEAAGFDVIAQEVGETLDAIDPDGDHSANVKTAGAFHPSGDTHLVDSPGALGSFTKNGCKARPTTADKNRTEESAFMKSIIAHGEAARQDLEIANLYRDESGGLGFKRDSL